MRIQKIFATRTSSKPINTDNFHDVRNTPIADTKKETDECIIVPN